MAKEAFEIRVWQAKMRMSHEQQGRGDKRKGAISGDHLHEVSEGGQPHDALGGQVDIVRRWALCSEW